MLQVFRITLSIRVLNFKFGAPPGEPASMAAHQRILRVPSNSYLRVSAFKVRQLLDWGGRVACIHLSKGVPVPQLQGVNPSHGRKVKNQNK